MGRRLSPSQIVVNLLSVRLILRVGIISSIRLYAKVMYDGQHMGPILEFVLHTEDLRLLD